MVVVWSVVLRSSRHLDEEPTDWSDSTVEVATEPLESMCCLSSEPSGYS